MTAAGMEKAGNQKLIAFSLCFRIFFTRADDREGSRVCCENAGWSSRLQALDCEHQAALLATRHQGQVPVSALQTSALPSISPRVFDIFHDAAAVLEPPPKTSVSQWALREERRKRAQTSARPRRVR